MDMLHPGKPPLQLNQGVKESLYLVAGFPLQTKPRVIKGIKHEGPGFTIYGYVPIPPLPKVSHPTILKQESRAVMLVRQIQ
jgi:hypothetical protein